ncbi:MAG: bacterial transcriptional activator domain-containing protein, partial [Deltaproteobacteria bacterium]|nr:bacterial transcriptional activator domain-containing protein [Deltaproteobacteria bacterium]
SKSMFSAFGVDRSRPQVTWSGEDEAVVSQHGGFGDGEMASDSGVLGGLVGTTGAGGGGVVRGKGGGMAKSRGPRPTTATKTSRERSRNKGEKSDRKSADKSDPLDGLLLETESKPRAARRRRRPALGRRGGYWAQRVRTTVARISPSAPGNSEAAVDAARASLDQQPDSRDRHRLYVRALSYAGQLEEAERAAEAWLVRDQLDAEALTYLSDAIGRQGRRQEALRILSGIVDLDPDREVLHQRLIKAYRRAGRTNAACGHQVALAEVGDAKAEAIGAGARCLRVLGRAKQAARLVDSVASGKLRVQAEAAASRPEPAARTRGAFTVKASWDRDVDLDLSIVTPQGTRLSWMGGRKRVIADRAHSRAGELLGLTRATPGTYVLEVSRTGEGAQSGPVSGELMINAHGRRQRLRFNLEGERAVVGSVRVWREWRTVR